MKRRVLGIVLALILATVGTLALVAYVKSAKKDASKNEEQVKVYVVTKDIRLGATVSEIKQQITLTDVPKRLEVTGAVTDLTQLKDTLVAGVRLKAGEQLLSSRLVDPLTLVRVAVPNGLQEMTVALPPERAVGAALSPGDTVGIVISYDSGSISSTGPTTASTTTLAGGTDTTSSTTPRSLSTTHLTLQKILVTAVQLSQQDSQRASKINVAAPSGAGPADTIAANVNEAPSGQLLITLAVSGPQVEQIVFAAEFGHIWLTLEGANADEGGTRILTLDQAYVTVGKR